MIKAFLYSSSLILLFTMAQNVSAETSHLVSNEQRESRLSHAQELLGRHYLKSDVRFGEKVQKINGQIYQWTLDGLPKRHKKKYQIVAQTIIDESLRYEYDPIFLLSVIEGESSFNPDMVGKVGEIGLMQIRPSTAKWIAQKYHLPWHGKKSLKNPVVNVQIGAAYLDYLRERFDSHARLYLAAYNMGAGGVEEALSRNIWPKDYPLHVMKRYVDFYAELKEQQAPAVKSRKAEAFKGRLATNLD